MIADVIIVVAMRFVDRGIAAEKKVRQLEEQHAEQNREMDKGEKLAQKARQRQQQVAANKKGSPKSSGGGGGRSNPNNIQQPSKRD